MSLLPILLAIHISLAVVLFLPSILLPLLLRRRPEAPHLGPITALMMIQSNGTLVIGLGLAISGAGLLAILGAAMLSQPWLVAGLSIYLLNLLLAFFIQRPNMRRLLRLSAGDDATWRARARRQRYVSYLMAALVGTIGVLMSTKPELW